MQCLRSHLSDACSKTSSLCDVYGPSLVLLVLRPHISVKLTVFSVYVIYVFDNGIVGVAAFVLLWQVFVVLWGFCGKNL